MSQALLAIQNILQNSNIFNRSRETVHFTPFGEIKSETIFRFLPTSVSYLNPSFTKGEGIEPIPPQFFFITFAKNKLETPKFAQSNFNSIHIGGYDQISDRPQNLGGGEVQNWESVGKNVRIIGFFDIFWDILNKMKDSLGQECVKGRLLSFQGKIGTIATDFSKK